MSYRILINTTFIAVSTRPTPRTKTGDSKFGYAKSPNFASLVKTVLLQEDVNKEKKISFSLHACVDAYANTLTFLGVAHFTT